MTEQPKYPKLSKPQENSLNKMCRHINAGAHNGLYWRGTYDCPLNSTRALIRKGLFSRSSTDLAVFQLTELGAEMGIHKGVLVKKQWELAKTKMATENRRELVQKLEAKQLALHAQGGQNERLTKEIASLYNELYPDDQEDEATCCNCGVTFVEMADFDGYAHVVSSGRCVSCSALIKQGRRSGKVYSTMEALDNFLSSTWMIQNKENSELWWSNEWGWVDLLGCDLFTDQEKSTLNLPLEGEWVKYTMLRTLAYLENLHSGEE